MQAIYFYGLPNGANPLDMDVNNVNGTPGSYGVLADLVSSDPAYFWGSWCSTCDAIPCCDSSITSITVTGGGPSYAGTILSFVGGRPCRPVAK